MGNKTSSFVDVEKQEELKVKFEQQETQRMLEREKAEKEIAEKEKFNIEKSARLMAAVMGDDSIKQELKLEVPFARKRKISKDDSDGSDSGYDNPTSKDTGNNYEYDKLLSLPFKDLFEKSKVFPADSFLILMKVLNHIFEGKSLSDKDLAFLSKPELTLLSAFFSKKCKVSFSCHDKLTKIAELINSHKSAYKHKRNEENYKLVFKKAIKHLTKTYKKNFPETRGDKKKLLLGFYKHYFRDDFIKLGLEREYELPRHDENKLVENFSSLIYNPKTVNPKYISMVALSKTFITDFLAYINDHFMQDYTRSRYNKVERILDNCKDIVKLAAHSGNHRDLIEKVERNPRFKLPWYDDELTKALSCVKSYLIGKCGVSALMFTF